jgi:G3E family GTPase
VIETSGLADPGPILQTFATDRALGDTFHVDVLAAVADAAAGLDTLEWSADARKQVILADQLIVTKGDIAGAKTEKLIERLRALNPRVPVSQAVNGTLDPATLTEPSVRNATPFVAEATHSDGIGSFVIETARPLNFDAFSRAMETLISLRGADLLRVKGFLNIEGCRGPVLVQFVQHLAHPPVELEKWPDANRGGRMVFITRNLPEEKIRALLAAVEGLA